MGKCKIPVTEPHSGELGAPIPQGDHGFAWEEYSDEPGQKTKVAVHDIQDPHGHIFTDLDSAYQIRTPPGKYRRL